MGRTICKNCVGKGLRMVQVERDCKICNIRFGANEINKVCPECCKKNDLCQMCGIYSVLEPPMINSDIWSTTTPTWRNELNK